MRHHLIRLASGPFISFPLAKFGWVAFADLRVQRLEAEQNTEFTEGAQKLWSYFNPFVDQPPNSNSAEMFVQCTYPGSFIILCLLVQKISC